jgi:hypothetical protein
MKIIRLLAFVLSGVLVLATPARAAIECPSPEPVQFMPAHPASVEPVTWFTVSFSRSDPTLLIAVQTTIGANNQVTIDTQTVINPALVPAADLLGPYPYVGQFGPLPPGHYTVTVTHGPGCALAQGSIDIGAKAAPTTVAPVVEFYNAALDQYHSTLNGAEIADLDTGVHPGWMRTGQSFLAYVTGQDDDRGVIVQRWYGKPDHGLNSHFLTWVFPEEDALSSGFLAGAWIFENGATFVIPAPLATTGACPAGTVPVYRLWNNRADAGHRYTSDKVTQMQMISAGYVAEGFGPDRVFFCGLAPAAP